MQKIVEQWAQAWSARRNIDLEEIYDSEVVFRTAGMNRSFSGSNRLKQFTKRLDVVTPRTSIDVVEILEAKNGQAVAVLWKTKAPNPLNPEHFTEQEGITRLKIKDGKIVDEETVFDRLDLLADVLATKKSL